MSAPYKVEEQHLYTEVVYYDAEGNEVQRIRHYDDHLYDGTDHLDVTDQEIENYYP